MPVAAAGSARRLFHFTTPSKMATWLGKESALNFGGLPLGPLGPLGPLKWQRSQWHTHSSAVKKAAAGGKESLPQAGSSSGLSQIVYSGSARCLATLLRRASAARIRLAGSMTFT